MGMTVQIYWSHNPGMDVYIKSHKINDSLKVINDDESSEIVSLKFCLLL